VRALARAGLFCLLPALLFTTACSAQPQKVATQSPAPALAAEPAPPPQQTSGFDGNRAFAHVEKLVSFGPRPPASEGLRRSQEYIRSQLQSDGCAVEEDDFHAATPIGSVAMKNIVVKIPGHSSGIVLLLTHYDTLRLADFVGADDSASSTALMLELARLYCGKKNPLTTWIAFLDGEEAFVQWSDTDSTYGSRELAAKLALAGDLKRVKAVILADMIGDRSLDIRRESNSTPWLTDLVWQTAQRLGYQKYFLDDTTAIQDDHLPFLRRGVPAVDIIDLDYPYWHTPADTIDKVSPKSIAIVGHVVVATLRELPEKIH
jgi:glutaminyl-peptide cyclotransferase